MFDKFLKECGVTARSLTYLIFCVALVAMFVAQYRVDVNHDLAQAEKGILFKTVMWGGTNNNLLVKPTPDMKDYGSVNAEVPEQVQRNMAYRLYRDIVSNRYDTYRLGLFLTHRSLSFDNQQQALAIFSKITGRSFHDVDADFYEMDLNKVMTDRNLSQKQAMSYLGKNYYKQLKNEFDPNQSTTRYYDYEKYIPVNKNISYADFKKQIGQLRKLIKGQSDVYMDFAQYGSTPLSYDEALAQYETFVNKDRVSGAYARLFCDYMGILAGILPVLIAWAISVGGLIRDNRGRLESSAHGPGAENVWLRFFSMSAMAFLPILVLAVVATVELSSGVRHLGLSIDHFAFVRYSIAWLLPTVMFTVAVGLFFSIVTKGSAGIFVQLAIWYWSVLRWGKDGLEPVKYGASMILRHTTVGGYDTYASSLGVIITNRLAYTVLALILIAAAWYTEKNRTSA